MATPMATPCRFRRADQQAVTKLGSALGVAKRPLSAIGLDLARIRRGLNNRVEVVGMWVMPRVISKSDIDFGLIGIDADEVQVWIDREANQLIVGDRAFDLSQLSPEQRDRLRVMADEATLFGGANDTIRHGLANLVDELIRKHTQ